MPTKSHTTQVMQNYFDWTDTRARKNPTSLENQLLNMAAVELEDLDLRSFRESAQTLNTVPTNIDNGGVYYSSPVPNALLTGDPAQTVVSYVFGITGSDIIQLSPYKDTLPVPTRVSINSASIVPLVDPIMFTCIGSGDSQARVWTVQYVFPGDFPTPNVLTLWVDQIGLNLSNVILTIIGEVFPQPAWSAERNLTTEVLKLQGEGVGVTTNRWSTIHQITVRGLPLDARLRGWSLPFNLPAVPDFARPFSIPQDRLITYERFWQIDNENSLLREMYEYGFSGLVTYNSYQITDPLRDVAVEPNTYGMYAVSNTTLYYMDRREIMPNCAGTGLTTEPLFGLQVYPDITKEDNPVRYVVLSGVPYAKAGAVFQYRYTVNDANCILPNGALGSIHAGWQVGAPVPVSVPLLQNGDYKFKLQTQDINGVTAFDVVPWRNSSLSPFASIDITDIIDVAKGLTFDSYGKLWVWDGYFAIPLSIHHDAYILDTDSSSIFVTDTYSSLQFSTSQVSASSIVTETISARFGEQVFNLSSAPFPTASLILFRNGLALIQDIDYTLLGNVVTLNSVMSSGDILLAHYYTSGYNPGPNAEIPNGIINGSNTLFDLSKAPNPRSSLILFQNGVFLTQGVDYVLSGEDITTTSVLSFGDSLIAYYRSDGISANTSENEVPGGVQNGSNVIFTLLHPPLRGLLLFLNGIVLTFNADYTIFGSVLILNTAPSSDDVLVAYYRY